MVHRLLTATLNRTVVDEEGEEVDSLANFYASGNELEKIAENCNEQKEASKKAQERSDRVYLCLYLQKNPTTTQAIVFDFGEKVCGLDVCLHLHTYIRTYFSTF